MTRWMFVAVRFEPHELGELVRMLLPGAHVGFAMLWLVGAAFDGARECPKT